MRWPIWEHSSTPCPLVRSCSCSPACVFWASEHAIMLSWLRVGVAPVPVVVDAGLDLEHAAGNVGIPIFTRDNS